MASEILNPPVSWAQTPKVIYVTVCVEDCKNAKCNIESAKLTFEGNGGKDDKKYTLSLDLFTDIDLEKSKYFTRERVIEYVLIKKENGPFWPRLTKDKVKLHWLRIDFTRWVNEDDSGESGGEDNIMSKFQNQDYSKYMNMNPPSLDDINIDDESEGSDDEEDALPDLE